MVMNRSGNQDNISVRDPLKDAPLLLARKVRLAQACIGFERAWRALLWPFAVAGCFLLLTLGEIWSLLPPLLHQAGIIGFAIGLIISFVPLMRLPWPSREEGLRRLEQVSGVRHRPATSFEDELGEGASEEQQALWALHRQRLAEMLRKLSAGWPHPRLGQADPYALRAALLLLLAIGFTAAGDATLQRFKSAFAIGSQDLVSRFRVDAWVTPPIYTSKPPIVLANGSETQNIRQITTPEKSLLLVRVNGPAASRPMVQVTGKAGGLKKSVEPSSNDDAFAEYKITITEPMSVVVGTTGLALATWNFDVIKDTVPIIELTREPNRAPRGAIRFAYRVMDDYGVASAQATFALPDSGDKPDENAKDITDRLHADEALKAFDPPVISLNLPRANTKLAEARTFKNLTSHPWAGLKVVMTLVARDQGGQEGKSEPFEFILPSRKFTKPMAKAIIEQRKKLVRNPRDRQPVEAALAALTIAPERFIEDKVLYLGLRSAFWRLHSSRTTEGLKSVVSQLWDLALRVEDGDLPQAEADLKTAQDELRKALEEGASEAEIAQLMDKLREALNRFLQAMAEKARQNGNLAKMPEGLGSQKTLSNKDLEEMLRNIENLAKTGSRDMAQRLLDQLSGMMQRLQMGQDNPNAQSQQMMNTVQGLGEVIQRQQKLLDETFKAQRKLQDREEDEETREARRRSRQRQAEQNGGIGQRNGRRGEQGRRGQGRQGQQGRGQYGEGEGQNKGKGRGSGDKRYGALSNRQDRIRQRLDGLLEQLRTLGTRPPDQLEDAGKAMNEAGKALDEENLGRATQQQTLALDRLRQGTQSVAEQVLQTLATRFGQGGQRNKDPFGRPERTQGPDMGTSVKVPDEIDIQRAREILDELRKRLGEPSRPMLELDYLERLIQQF
jgi:uncharacterized protein (TIGR02302 family)